MGGINLTTSVSEHPSTDPPKGVLPTIVSETTDFQRNSQPILSLVQKLAITLI